LKADRIQSTFASFSFGPQVMTAGKIFGAFDWLSIQKAKFSFVRTCFRIYLFKATVSCIDRIQISVRGAIDVSPCHRHLLEGSALALL
jgi:hypothetical protein